MSRFGNQSRGGFFVSKMGARKTHINTTHNRTNWCSERRKQSANTQQIACETARETSIVRSIVTRFTVLSCLRSKNRAISTGIRRLLAHQRRSPQEVFSRLNPNALLRDFGINSIADNYASVEPHGRRLYMVLLHQCS